MIDLKYPVGNFNKRKFKAVELEKIKGIKRIQSLYKQAKSELPVSQHSLYMIEYFIAMKIAKSALSKHFRDKKLLTKEERQAFLQTQAAKVVVVDAMNDLGIHNRSHLFNIVQTLMLIDLGIDLAAVGKAGETGGWDKGEERQTRKPSITLNKLIKEAQDKVEAAGLDRKDRYLIVKELDNMAFNKYVGDNYHNQLKRMGIHRTTDYLAYVEYVLERS